MSIGAFIAKETKEKTFAEAVCATQPRKTSLSGPITASMHIENFFRGAHRAVFMWTKTHKPGQRTDLVVRLRDGDAGRRGSSGALRLRFQ